MCYDFFKSDSVTCLFWDAEKDRQNGYLSFGWKRHKSNMYIIMRDRIYRVAYSKYDLKYKCEYYTGFYAEIILLFNSDLVIDGNGMDCGSLL